MPVTPFDFQPRTRIVFGPGTFASLGNLAEEMDVRRALIVSDPGIVQAGYPAQAAVQLDAAGIQAFLFADVHENPTTADVAAGLTMAQQCQPQLIIGLGGGSSMDCAKGINFLYTNGGEMRDYWGVGKASLPMLPMIAVPTTAGTGSETQSFALISDAVTHVKMACGDKKAAFRVALLDPRLTLTQPTRVTALTGIDAIAHALETYVTRRRNPVSITFSRQAWTWLTRSFTAILAEPQDLESRAGMQLGACWAGMAIENSMLGAAHALANPLTARYGIAHGQAVAVMLPHVVRFNGPHCHHWYQELLQSGPDHHELPAPNGSPGPDLLARWLQQLLERAGLATSLLQLDVPADDLETLAAAAAEQWTAQFNPVPVDRHSLHALYHQALETSPLSI